MQFTADLMPSDLIGVSVFERSKEAFVFHPGPVFAQVLLADEINRAGPKTQSALLEAMEEQQVSIDNETRALPQPFFVIATQNPSDQLGTYPLPESQLDRFLMRITLGYPDRASERALLAGEDRRHLADAPGAGDAAGRTVGSAAGGAAASRASDALLDYLQALIAATRDGRWFVDGLSPRAGIAVLRVARARALMAERGYVAPDDIQAILPQAIAHRLSPVRRRRPRRDRAGARDGRGHADPVTRGAWRAPPAAPACAPRGCAAQVWRHRLPLTDTWTLGQRNIYILPTRGGAFVRRPAAGDAAGVDQLPAQPGLRADLPARRRGAGVDAHDARHAARADAAPAPGAPVFAGDPALLEVVLTTPGGARYAHRGTPAGPRARRPQPCLGRRAGAGPGQRHRQRRAAGARLAPGAAAGGRDRLPVRPVPRLDGVAPGGARAGLAAARAAAAAAAAGQPGAGRRAARAQRGRQRDRRRARLAARRPAAPGGVEEGRAQRRAGQPRHRRHRQPGAVAGLGRDAGRRRRAAAVAAGGLGRWRPSAPGWPTACACPAPSCPPARATPSGARRWSGWRCGTEPGARSLAPPAARSARHAVPAGRDRLDDRCRTRRTWRPGASRWPALILVARARLALRGGAAAQPLDAGRGAGAGGRR